MLSIKKWFMNKNFNQNEAYAISVSDLTVLKETEKAYYLSATSDYGTLKFWCPKSCTFDSETESDNSYVSASSDPERGIYKNKKSGKVVYAQKTDRRNRLIDLNTYGYLMADRYELIERK